MKRGFALVLLLCVGMVAHAQWAVSTNLALSYSGYNYAQGGISSFDKTLPQGWSLDFSPRIGYCFNERYTAGIDLGFGYSRYTYSDGFYSPISQEWEQSEMLVKELFSSSVGLFLRRQLLSWGRLSLHAELAAAYRLGFGLNTTTQYSGSSSGYTDEIVTSHSLHEYQTLVELIPVLHYDLGNQPGFSHFSLDLYLNFLSVAFLRTTTNLYAEHSEMNDGTAIARHTVTTDFDLSLRLRSAALLSLGVTYQF